MNFSYKISVWMRGIWRVVAMKSTSDEEKGMYICKRMTTSTANS